MKLQNGKLAISQYRMNQLKKLTKADQTKIMRAISSLIEASGEHFSVSGFEALLRPAQELAATPCKTGSDRSKSFLWVGSLAKSVDKQKDGYLFIID